MDRDRNSERLKEYLENYLLKKGLDLRHNFPCLNPEHADSNTPSMAYWKGHNKVRCFGQCDRTFDLFDIIGFDYGISDFLEQLEIAERLYGKGENLTSANENKRKSKAQKEAAPPPDFSALYPVYHAQLGKTTYFTERGLGPEIQECFSLGYDEAAKAVVIPISSRYYITRKTKEKAYRNYGSVEPLNLAALYQADPVFITESAIDALSVLELGFQAIALNGTPHQKPLLDSLANYSQKISTPGAKPPLLVILFDNDPPGHKAALELSDKLIALNVPHIKPELPKWYEDPNQALKLHKRNFQALLEEILEIEPEEAQKTPKAEIMKLTQNPPTQDQEDRKETAQKAQLSGFQDIFFHGEYKDSYIPTGFKALDELLYDGLREGLYMLGAVSSMGKTTYSIQMAHQIAEQGHSVAYIALEQGREEILAKSLSMLTGSQEDNSYPASAREIRRYSLLPEHYRPGIQRARERLSKYAANLFIYEEIEGGMHSLVKNHIAETGEPPSVIFIDYLQIMPKPLGFSSAQDKQIVDANVNMLRRLAREYHIPILALSILSRTYYSKPLTLQAYKETGGIEAGADYLLGLQAYNMAEWASGAVTGAIYDFHSLYKQEYRDLELVILKARNGVPGTIPLRYYPKFNFFNEMKPEDMPR
jgi:replicative DNA helicase